MKQTKKLLIVSLVLILIGSFFASMFNSSFFSVKVDKIEFKTDKGKLTGLLYMPKDAGKDDPRPVIVTTHGYLNSKEMQDAPAIEMSRRGYIVLAVDMYDHGDSVWEAPIAVGEQFGTFWIYSQSDAAKYVAQQDYTKKDANGNSYIAVSGHSMGGFSSLVALYMDEMNALQTGVRNIYTGISVGADFSYASSIASEADYIAAFGDRTVGMIAGHYDEFFFNNAKDKEKSGTVRYKDFITTNEGAQFLGYSTPNDSLKPGDFYTVDSGELVIDGNKLRNSQSGKHVIYTPNESHPWNHFSKETTSNLIDFYREAFDGVTSPNQKNIDLPSNNQIWFFKELCNFIALIGFFLLVIPVISLLLNTSYFKSSITDELSTIPHPDSKNKKILSNIILVFSCLYSVLLFTTLINKKEFGLNILLTISIIVAISSIIALIYGVNKKNNNLIKSTSGLTVVSIIAALVFKFAQFIIPLSHTFNEPTTNQIAYWALASGLITAVFTIITYLLLNKNQNVNIKDYGFIVNIKSILSSLAVAILAVVILYIVVFIIQFIFKTDFRIWTLAVRTFTLNHFLTALRYVPIFLIFYFINTIAINANTRDKKHGNLLALCLNIGGLVLWLLLQYGMLFITGESVFPQEALNGILLFALVPCLGIASIYARVLFKKTNNVWLASFVNTLLFTMITVANTVMFWNIG